MASTYRFQKWFCCCLTIASLPVSTFAVPVIPGAAGYGIETPAGRGGIVLRVTNLEDGGPGSLRAALTAKGPRVVIFEISGTIELTKDIVVKEPFLTLAGQTAPSPGILLRGAGVFIETSDVLVQHLAIRPGDGDAGPPRENRDALDVSVPPGGLAENVVIDHVSCSWSTDEVFTTWGSSGKNAQGMVRKVTVMNSIFSEALGNAGHPKGPHPMGVLLGSNTEGVSFYGNILAFNPDRNPLCRDDCTDLQIVNNFTFYPGPMLGNRIKYGVISGDRNIGLKSTARGNVVILHPRHKPQYSEAVYVQKDAPADLRLYLDDNIVWDPLAANGTGAWLPESGDPYDAKVFVATGHPGVVRLKEDPYVFLGVPVMPAREVEAHVVAHAGSRPADRDPVDRRIIHQIKTRTGGWIDSPAEVGGYPKLAENRITHELPKNPNADDDSDGYTNLEEWLHVKAAEVEHPRNSS